MTVKELIELLERCDENAFVELPNGTEVFAVDKANEAKGYVTLR
jgi:hypothetical protein